MGTPEGGCVTLLSKERYFDHEHITVIEPPRSWRMLDWRELWAYRELLWVLTARDVKVRYKQTILGTAWAVLRPLTTMLIFTIVFGRLAKMPSEGYPYPIFIYAALLPWTFFAAAISTSGQSLVASAPLVSKVYFPRLVISLSSIGASLVDLLVSSSLLLLLMYWYRVGWTWNLLAAPLLIAGVVFTALGIGTLLSALTVAYRDFAHITPFIVQIWMYITPVVFPVTAVPVRWQWLLYLNPMTGMVEGFRSVFLGRSFDLGGLSASFGISLLILMIGVAYFDRTERQFADVI
jgi:homopolymeric O-antigen transport system permease protein